LDPEISVKARDSIACIDGLLDRLAADLADEAKPVDVRMGLATECAPKIESLLKGVVEEGIGHDHPALAGVGAKVQAIGARLDELGSRDAPPPA
jgi:hypothetical protein